VVSQIVLADEINRATPKTQSALLEAMEERHMTVDGTTRPLPQPFMVIATQNPIEYEGTFPLPEAQLDRFMLRLRMGYPDHIDEMLILDEQKRGHPVDALSPVADAAEVLAMQHSVREIYVDPAISDYIVRLVSATRSHPDVYLGASPRGSLALYRASQALAAFSGRDYVIPDDVKALAEPALSHRIILKTAASIRGVDGRSVVSEMLMSVPIGAQRPSAREQGVRPA
jgi:MoxR-like ATPase